MRFKSINFNRHNGTIGFIGEDDNIYWSSMAYGRLGRFADNKYKLGIHQQTLLGRGYHISLSGEGVLSGNDRGELVPVSQFSGPLASLSKQTRFVFGDLATNILWYIDERNVITPLENNGSLPLPPKIDAVMFTVWHNMFYAMDRNNKVWRWQKDNNEWQDMKINAKMINRDAGFVGTQLYYIGMDDAVYMINDNMVPTKISDFKCRYLAIYSRQVHAIGMDGLYYILVHNNCWQRIDFPKV
jgi:hypothetical protein